MNNNEHYFYIKCLNDIFYNLALIDDIKRHHLTMIKRNRYINKNKGGIAEIRIRNKSYKQACDHIQQIIEKNNELSLITDNDPDWYFLDQIPVFKYIEIKVLYDMDSYKEIMSAKNIFVKLLGNIGFFNSRVEEFLWDGLVMRVDCYNGKEEELKEKLEDEVLLFLLKSEKLNISYTILDNTDGPPYFYPNQLKE